MSKTEKTVGDIFDSMSKKQRTTAYKLIGQALEYGDHMKETLIMFNKEESAVLQVLISQAISGDYDKSIYKKARSIIPKVEED